MMKFKSTKIIFFLFLVLSMIFNMIPTGETSPTIRVGWFTTDGAQFIDNNGDHSGYCYEYYQEIAKYNGWKYEYIPGSWQECLNRLENGEIDVLAFVQYTPERGAVFDFTQQNMGRNYTILTANIDDTRTDLTEFDNCTIGVLKGATQIKLLPIFAAENGLHYTEKMFDNLGQLLIALENKEIDLMLHHSFRTLNKHEKIISKFSPLPFYFAVQKNNTLLRQKFDNALIEITMTNPQFDTFLTNKYYHTNIAKTLTLTPKEKNFLKTLPLIRVVAAPPNKPFNYMQDGKLSGINKDILDKITTSLGIKYEFIETNSYSESLEMVRSGQADLLCSFSADYSWAEKNHLSTTIPLLELSYSVVSRRETLPTSPTIAAIKGIKFNESYLKIHYPNNKTVYYDTADQCLLAVKNGDQDITFINTYNAEDFMRNYYYYNLTASLVPYTNYVSFATSSDAPELCIILDKALSSIGNDEIKNIIAANTVFQSQPFDIRSFFYQKPLETISILAFIVFTLIVLFFIIIRTKNKHTQLIRHMLFTDEITNYPNYKKFKVDSEKIIQINPSENYAILYTDIQKFKYINDTLGREHGDAILLRINEHLNKFIVENELCSRVYADHFVILLKYTDEQSLRNRERELTHTLDLISDPVAIGYKIIIKIGVYLLPHDEYDIEKSVNLANYAKDTIDYVSENTCIHYDEKMRLTLQQEKSLEANMNTALENSEFEAYFQPRVDILTKTIVGAEALVRWIHPQKGFLSPDQFIPFFEKNGFITKVDFYMFEAVCHHLRQLLNEGQAIVPISSNFSRNHLNNPDFPDQLMAIAKRYNVPTNMIEIEITETVAIYNFQLAMDMTKKLKNYGFMIAVDDFGSGYSSIQLLYNLPLDVLKIDKEYTQKSIHSQIESTIMSSIIDIVHNHQIKVLFEGVENKEQEDFVKAHQCRLVQGYFYSKPVPFTKFKELLISMNN